MSRSSSVGGLKYIAKYRAKLYDYTKAMKTAGCGLSVGKYVSQPKSSSAGGEAESNGEFGSEGRAEDNNKAGIIDQAGHDS